MRKSLVLAGTALATIMSQAALAGDDGAWNGCWYLSMGAGVNWMNDGIDLPTVTPTFTAAHGFDADTGWTVAASVGHRMEGNWRLEAEVSDRWNDFDAGLVGPGAFVNFNGNLSVIAAMVNALVDIPVSDRMNISLGAGVGYAWANGDLTISGSSGGGPTTTSISQDDSGFAYQGIAGVSMSVGDQSELFLEYRYFAANGIDPFAPLLDEDYRSHSVRVGLRFYMQGDGS